MRITVIAPSLQLGGLENAASLMANYLADADHDVSMALCYRAERFYQLRDSIRVFEPTFTRGQRQKTFFYASWIRFLRKYVLQAAPDVVLSYGDFHNALVLAALAGTRTPVVISDRASPSLNFSSHLAWLRRHMYGRAAGIIAQTKRAAEAKWSLVGARVPIAVIPNPVREFGAPLAGQRERFILAAARHYPVKGLDRLIDAFSRARPQGWELRIAGSEGPATAELMAKVDRHCLSDRVRFLGAVRDMETLYSTAGIFVLPSRSEGFPNALIEAMALGCPPIAFDINAGPAEIIEPGINGLLVTDGDIDGLATAIQRLVDDQQLRAQIGQSASRIAEQNSLSRIGKRVEEFLAMAAGFPISDSTGPEVGPTGVSRFLSG